MGERKREHSDPGNVITLSGLGAPAGEGEIEWPVEDRNLCVRSALVLRPLVRAYPSCGGLLDRAINFCMQFKFPKADAEMGKLRTCLMKENERDPRTAEMLLHDMMQEDLSDWYPDSYDDDWED